MLLKAFAIYDMKSEMYSRPFFAINAGEATRIFGDAVNEAGSPYNKHPEDFTLYGVGSYDDLLGELDKATHENLGCALTYLNTGGPILKDVSDG